MIRLVWCLWLVVGLVVGLVGCGGNAPQSAPAVPVIAEKPVEPHVFGTWGPDSPSHYKGLVMTMTMEILPDAIVIKVVCTDAKGVQDTVTVKTRARITAETLEILESRSQRSTKLPFCGIASLPDKLGYSVDAGKLTLEGEKGKTLDFFRVEP